MTRPSRAPDFSERFFRALLWLYPPSFRRRFGDEMVEFFMERRVEQYRRGRGGARLWAHLLADIALNAPLLHLHALATRTTALRPATSHDVPWSSPEYPAETQPMETLRQDIRYAFRTLLRRPGFVAVAIITLALGIGATTAIYSVVDAVLVRSLPWPNADRLVTVTETRDGVNQGGVSYMDFVDWRTSSKVFDEVGVLRGQSVNLTGGESPERVVGSFVDASMFRVLGARASQGRVFADAETIVEQKVPVAVISDGFWQSHFGSKSVLGTTLILNGQPLRIIGVLSADFAGPQGTADVWMPIAYYPNTGELTTRGSGGVGVLGRLKRGVPIEQAQSDLSTISARIADAYPASNKGMGVSVLDLKEQLVGGSRTQILIVLSAVAMVLMIACANVANLQLARAASRRHELSVRSALGAGRTRLVRQLITESLLLSIGGGALGLFIAWAGTRWLAQAVPNYVSFYGTIALDPMVLGFAALLTMVTGLLFGLPPAWRASRVRLQDALTVRSAGGRSAALGRRSPLVLAQMALCVVLLVTAGLLTRSLVALTRLNPGFDAEHVLTMQFRLPPTKYDTPEKIATMFASTITELRAVPGVKSAALVRATPLNGNGQTIPYLLDGADASAKNLPSLQFNIVSSGYFETMRIPMIAGRDFAETDRAGAQSVAIVNAQLAAKIAPTGSAIGKRVRIGAGNQGVWATVVGIVGNAKHFLVSEHQVDQAYAVFAQTPLIFTEVVLRTSGEPAAIANAARNAIWRVDRDQPVWRVRPLTQSIEGQLGSRVFMLRLLAGFSVLAVVLAMIGIYGVTSYSVAGRTQEMGIRMALGARAAEVIRMVVRESMKTIAIAIALGLIASAGLSRLIESQLYGVNATDPVIYLIVPVALGLVALVACWLPARRASRVDPVTTLRAD